MTNFVSTFIPQYAEKTAPLRQLLRADVEFVWDERMQQAFVELKETLTKAPVLRYFDSELPVVLSVDASHPVRARRGSLAKGPPGGFRE